MLISVSFLKNKTNNKLTIDEIDNSKCDMIHVDIMDGKFVDNKTITNEEAVDLLKGRNKNLDIHIMVEHPLDYINELKVLKPKYITFHVESLDNINEVIDELKKENIGVGIALNPETRIYNIIPYLKRVDLILVMSVNPGKGGQTFIESTYSKVNELKAMQKKYNYLISVDGGINDNTIKKLKSDIACVGSYITMADNFDEKITILKDILK